MGTKEKYMRVSIVVTVLNEGHTVSRLLNSTLLQSENPDEILIIDGGSDDGTVRIIEHYQKKSSKIKQVIEKGSIAHGRNTGIEMAKNDLIAMIDAGCVADKDWLKKITEPFTNKDIDMVAGFYEMVAITSFQKALAPFVGIPSSRFSGSFLPSARSMAFKRSLWVKVGGFCEKVDRAGEDTLFNYEVLKTGAKIARVKDAIVYWEVPKTLREAAKKFYYYARGDAQTGIWLHSSKGIESHNIKILLIFARYALLLAVFYPSFKGMTPLPIPLTLIFLYLLWSVWKFRDLETDWRTKLWFPIIQLISDICVMFGFIAGVFSRRRWTLMNE